jgi:purine nucleoside permease
VDALKVSISRDLRVPWGHELLGEKKMNGRWTSIGQNRKVWAAGAGGAALAGLVALILAAPASASISQSSSTSQQPISAANPFKVRALVVTMFDLETQPWLDNDKPSTSITVPTVTAPVQCVPSTGECIATLGEGKANAATSMTSILEDAQLDFSDAHFLISGISGINPNEGTLGSVALANFAVDGDLGTSTDPNDETAPHHYLEGSQYGTNVYQLNTKLVTEAFSSASKAKLKDDATSDAARKSFGQGQSKKTPSVTRCDTITEDDFWTGPQQSKEATYKVKLLTHGKATYCTTQQEDNATLTALARHGDLNRTVDLRAASDYDTPAPGQTPEESVNTFPGTNIATQNAYLAGHLIVKDLLKSK